MLLGEALQMVFRQDEALGAFEQALALEERADAAMAAGTLISGPAAFPKRPRASRVPTPPVAAPRRCGTTPSRSTMRAIMGRRTRRSIFGNAGSGRAQPAARSACGVTREGFGARAGTV